MRSNEYFFSFSAKSYDILSRILFLQLYEDMKTKLLSQFLRVFFFFLLMEKFLRIVFDKNKYSSIYILVIIILVKLNFQIFV